MEMTYAKAIEAVRAAPAAEREELWQRLIMQVPHGTPQLYTVCPVCDTTLDWAWCPVCKKYR